MHQFLCTLNVSKREYSPSEEWVVRFKLADFDPFLPTGIFAIPPSQQISGAFPSDRNMKRTKGKAIPLQAWGGPEGSRGWRSKNSRQSAHDSGKPYAPAAFTPRKYSRYSFLLEAESTPGPYCGRKDYVNEKFQWHHRESKLRPSDL